MSVRLEDLAAPTSPTARRQRIGAINRWLGWFILPLVVAALGLHYVPDGDAGGPNTAVKVLQFVFVPLMLVHLALSVYVFGLLRPARTLRVFHIWFGYAYIGLVLGSQTTFGIEPLHLILTTAMLLALAAHVGIGAFYAVRRRQVHLGRTALDD